MINGASIERDTITQEQGLLAKLASTERRRLEETIKENSNSNSIAKSINEDNPFSFMD